MWQIQHDNELDDFAQRVRDSLGIQPIEGMGHGSTSYPQGFAETTPNAPSSIVTPPLFVQLQSLMEWREKGLLSDTQFEAAKRALSLQ